MSQGIQQNLKIEDFVFIITCCNTLECHSPSKSLKLYGLSELEWNDERWDYEEASNAKNHLLSLAL